jgi:hypothetical protein
MSSPVMRATSYLQHALVLFAVCMVCLLCCADVVLEVGNSMLEGLQSLSKKLRNLKRGQLPALLVPAKDIPLKYPRRESLPRPRKGW